MRGVRRLVAVAAPRHDDAHRRLLLQHRPRLHRRGVRAQDDLVLAVGSTIEGVPDVARRVVGRDVEHIEVVACAFSTSGPSTVWKPIMPKISLISRIDQRRRMEEAALHRPTRQRHVDPLRGNAAIQRRRLERGLPRRQGRRQLILQRIHGHAKGTPLLGLDRRDRLRQGAHSAIVAEELAVPLARRRKVLRRVQFCQRVRAQGEDRLIRRSS